MLRSSVVYTLPESNHSPLLCHSLNAAVAAATAAEYTPVHCMEPARQGREKCRYDGDTRLVAGCLPVTPDGKLVLIGSVKRSDWILPKGGWDTDETAAEAAVREAYEEAGVRKYVKTMMRSWQLGTYK